MTFWADITGDTAQELFDSMFLRQFKLETITFGHDLPDLTIPERSEYTEENILAALDELHEALAECGWKPWATSRHINTPKFHSELVDAWHFLMNLGLVSGLDSHNQLWRAMSAHLANCDKPAHLFHDDESRAAAIRYEVLNISQALTSLRPDPGGRAWDRYASWGAACLHFFALCDIVGLGTGQLAGRYFKKADVNAARQTEGYDGVSTKCVLCHRELSEAPSSLEVGFCGYCRPMPSIAIDEAAEALTEPFDVFPL